MTKCALITKSSSKRVAADALLEAKRRRSWSNADLGDAMDCSEGSVRNRLDDDDVANQMLVHELRRITQSDGPAVANRVFADLGFRLMPIDGRAGSANALGVAAPLASTASALIEAAADGRIDRGEAETLLPALVDLCTLVFGLKGQLRDIIEGRAPPPKD